MFNNSIDGKALYTNPEGIEMKDLGESIFEGYTSKSISCTYYKVPAEMRMRPDLMAMASLGDEKYAEMIIKYSHIDNPFAIDFNDMIVVPTLNNIYNEVKDGIIATVNSDNTYELVKNYHKYIDPTKAPDLPGSEESNSTGSKHVNTNDNGSTSGTDLSKTSGVPTEANLSNNGRGGLSIINGRIYFGPNVSADTRNVTDVDGSNVTSSELVDCAKNGVTIGQFLNATVKNSVK